MATVEKLSCISFPSKDPQGNLLTSLVGPAACTADLCLCGCRSQGSTSLSAMLQAHIMPQPSF